MSLISDFLSELVPFLLRERQSDLSKCVNAAKQHTDSLKHNGDVGFQTSTKAWTHAVVDMSEKIIDENDTERHSALIESSRQWAFPIQSVQCSANRCVLFLDRSKCFENVLMNVLSDRQYFCRWKLPIEKDEPFAVSLLLHSNNDSLTELRCTLIRSVLANLLQVSGYHVTDDVSQSTVQLIVTHPRGGNEKRESENSTEASTGLRKIVCGAVKSNETVSATDYIRLRAKDMEKMADMKYGTHKEHSILYDYMKLGAGIVTFDLLRIKHTNVIRLDQLIAQSGTSKGAAFILYNVARLQSILTSFDEQVSTGKYKQLPPLDQIDFTVLKEEEEWRILYVFIDGFPNMLERCLTGIENGRIAIHLLCTYLGNFVALFSVYYHRVKILTDNEPGLTTTMNARIYLLKAIRVVLLKALVILGIEPLNQM